MSSNLNPPDRSVSASWELRRRALALIPHGTSTNSKAPRAELEGVEPCFIARGQDCRVWDVDGNEYIDYRNALGPVTLGYAHPVTTEAVRRRLDDGTVYGYPHPLEVELAEVLAEVIPCCEMVRFLKTGGEAMSAAIKTARAHTGREVVLRCGYHGWLQNNDEAGVPEAVDALLRPFEWGDVAGLERLAEEHRSQVAAVSLAGSYPHLTPDDRFLAACRRVADAHEALLIIDEIVTGFRVAVGGIQEYYGVEPDLAVFSKGMANGMPISALVGRRDVMRALETTTVSSTFSGDALSLAAALATIETYREQDVVGHLWRAGRRLVDGVNAIFDRAGIAAGFLGCPTCPMLVFDSGDARRDRELHLALLGGLYRRGVIIYSVCYVNFSHTDADLEETLRRWSAAVVEDLPS